jgi:hypothetical protein
LEITSKVYGMEEDYEKANSTYNFHLLPMPHEKLTFAEDFTNVVA